jgi:hypothetical protein
MKIGRAEVILQMRFCKDAICISAVKTTETFHVWHIQISSASEINTRTQLCGTHPNNCSVGPNLILVAREREKANLMRYAAPPSWPRLDQVESSAYIVCVLLRSWGNSGGFCADHRQRRPRRKTNTGVIAISRFVRHFTACAYITHACAHKDTIFSCAG